MATLRGLIDRLGTRGATRALKNIGINQPSGAPLNERYLRESVSGRLRDGKRVRQPENERQINALIRGTQYRDLPDPGEGEVASGAETHGTILRGKQGGYWIGEQDTREREAARELSKFQLRKLLGEVPLARGRTWLLSAMGIFVVDRAEQERYQIVGDEEVDAEGHALRRHARGWRRVAMKPGSLLYQASSRAATDWSATEVQVRIEEAAARRAAGDIARLAGGAIDARRLNTHLKAIREGGIFEGAFYPSFAARYMTVAGGREWLHVYAAAVRYPV